MLTLTRGSSPRPPRVNAVTTAALVARFASERRTPAPASSHSTIQRARLALVRTTTRSEVAK